MNNDIIFLLQNSHSLFSQKQSACYVKQKYPPSLLRDGCAHWLLLGETDACTLTGS